MVNYFDTRHLQNYFVLTSNRGIFDLKSLRHYSSDENRTNLAKATSGVDGWKEGGELRRISWLGELGLRWVVG
ncbi:hypothetical protein, partial [Cupriavidus sp. 2SB]|uniref:hypothetical protein n=1 Tax=Cupriavidus sp. 2SB TaxID=2502199 RepID=UPI001BB11F38